MRMSRIIVMLIMVTCFVSCGHAGEISFHDLKITLPDGFTETSSGCYKNENTGEVITLSKSETEDAPLEGIIAEKYGPDSVTTYSEFKGYLMAKTYWSVQKDSLQIYRVSYDIAKNKDLYNITFESVFSAFSDTDTMATVDFVKPKYITKKWTERAIYRNRK